MKTSVISPEFRQKYLEKPGDKDAFEGTAIVFEGPEDYHHRDQRSEPADRREQHPVHPLYRSGRLSGRGRGGEHAAARTGS
jgi:hypothetical protein